MDVLRLTFDPVSFVEVDLSLSLDSVRSDHHKMSPWNGAVQLPPGADPLAVSAGTEEKEFSLMNRTYYSSATACHCTGHL